MENNAAQRKPLEKATAYNHREVMTLKPLSEWTEAEEAFHLEHNLILQSNFASRSPTELIQDAKLTKQEWLTDFCCPSIQGALAICLAKEMVTKYRVAESDLNSKMQPALTLLYTPELESSLQSKLDDEIKKISDIELETQARIRCQKNFKNDDNITKEALDAAKRIEIDIKKKETTYKLINQYIKDNEQKIKSELGLELKPITYDTNQDFCFLGAAGSGKSTVAQKLFETQQEKDRDNGNEEKDPSDYITFAADNYRAFRLPDYDQKNKDPGKNVFSQTQDMAYMIKELVEKEISQMKERPDIIFDGITLPPTIRKAFQNSNVNSIIAAYSGSGFIGIAERAESRAQDANARLADRGRFVNTTSLLKGHADASSRLMQTIPDHTITRIYNTDVEKGEMPIEIGVIDTLNNKIQIKSLKEMADFLNKKNINDKATHPVSLIHPSDKPDFPYLLATHPKNKAKSILDLVKSNPQFQLEVLGLENVPYITMKSKSQDVIDCQINDDVFLKHRNMKQQMSPTIDQAKNKESLLDSIQKPLIETDMEVRILRELSKLTKKRSFVERIQSEAYNIPRGIR